MAHVDCTVIWPMRPMSSHAHCALAPNDTVCLHYRTDLQGKAKRHRGCSVKQACEVDPPGDSSVSRLYLCELRRVTLSHPHRSFCNYGFRLGFHSVFIFLFPMIPYFTRFHCVCLSSHIFVHVVFIQDSWFSGKIILESGSHIKFCGNLHLKICNVCKEG
ncbi:uncharacterized protein LOC119325896 [Triticum dicoccoides]|uniref:uncharacterized protein LOC119325896 n=1 Tax=Triticum dicoccoides TaxID=85692 RepID=UPI000E7CDF13|nr:uncharacterized protein LOC119325896 [Triticum dicoccoides]